MKNILPISILVLAFGILGAGLYYAEAGTVVPMERTVIGNSGTTSTLFVGDELRAATFVATSTTATSTFANGLTLTRGCIVVNGSCLVGGSSSGLTSYDAFTHVVTGTSATTTEMRLTGGLISASTTVQGSLTVGSLTATSTVILGTATGLVLRTSGTVGTYSGVTCTNQFLRILDASGAGTCATVVAGDVDLADLTATNSTLTFSGTYDGQTARTIGLNLGNSNTWTAAQLFGYTASTTFGGGLHSSGGFEGAYLTSSGRLELGTGSATSTITNYILNGGGLNIASSTGITQVALPLVKNLFGVTIPNPSTASTTIILPAKPWPFTATHAVCVVNQATNVVLRLIDPTGNATNNVTCTQTSTSTEQAFTSNNTFTRYEGASLQIVSVSGNPNQVNISIIGTVSAQ